MADRRAEFLTVQISMAAVAVFAVALRLITRFFILKCPGWDDYIIVLGMCLGLTQTILTLSCLPYGAAKHMIDITSRADLLYVLKIAYIVSITGPLVMFSVKASLLLLYLRISPCILFRRCVKFLLILFTLDTMVWSFLAVFQCIPIDKAWRWTNPGQCHNRELLYKAQGLWNLTENMVIIILPLPTFLRLQMHWRRRLQLILVLALSLVPCGAVIARVIPTTPPEVFRSDFTWWLISMQDWIAVEYCTGMVCASLILLKPLAQMLCGSRTVATAKSSAWPRPPNCSTAQPVPLYRPRYGKRSLSLPVKSHSGETAPSGFLGSRFLSHPAKDKQFVAEIPCYTLARERYGKGIALGARPRTSRDIRESSIPVPHSPDGSMVEAEPFSVKGESLRPLSYLKGLQSPDLESSPCEDPFSHSPSQQDYSSNASPCHP